MSLKRITILLALLALNGGNLHAAAHSTNSPATNRLLLIDPSSMPVTAGKATLIIGALERVDGVYRGDYKVKVSPYFFKSEKGRLAIVVSDESLAQVSTGKVVNIIGTATTNGQGGETRHIDAIATPANADRGQLKLWFLVGSRKMTFEPTYHFGERATATASAKTAQLKPTGSPTKAPEVATQRR